MITVQETTVWDGNFPNHKYILSDDKQKAYGYIKNGDRYPTMFSKPMGFDPRRRTFEVLIKTKDVEKGVWYIQGSKGDTYTVKINDEGEYTCSCPASMYRKMECKHIQQVRSKND